MISTHSQVTPLLHPSSTIFRFNRLRAAMIIPWKIVCLRPLVAPGSHQGIAPTATPGGGPKAPTAGARRPPPGEYKSKKISQECWTRQSLSFQICGYRHNWVLHKDVRNMHFYFGQWNSSNALSLSWFHRPEGFFQCPFIVMASQGSGASADL